MLLQESCKFLIEHTQNIILMDHYKHVSYTFLHSLTILQQPTDHITTTDRLTLTNNLCSFKNLSLFFSFPCINSTLSECFWCADSTASACFCRSLSTSCSDDCLTLTSSCCCFSHSFWLAYNCWTFWIENRMTECVGNTLIMLIVQYIKGQMHSMH